MKVKSQGDQDSSGCACCATPLPLSLSLSLSLVSYAKCSEEEKVEPIRCTLLEIFELAERAEFLEISAS